MPFTEYLKYKIIDRLVDQNVQFALYKLPKSKCITLVLQDLEKTNTYTDLTSLNSKKGFVISPFEVSEKHPIIIISPDNILKGEEQILEYVKALNILQTSGTKQTTKFKEGISDFEKYEYTFTKFHTTVEDNTLQKLVLSRTLDQNKEVDFSAGITFKKACDKYPNNFVYLCNSPQSGAWLGCSPEILLAGNQEHWKTDALAGTQKVGDGDNKIEWDEKNIHEQAIVAQYMESQLLKVGITSVHDKPSTIYSGDIVHLKSEFVFNIENRDTVGNILKVLHPSPAVCGFPKEKALEFIAKNEGYDRAYYSGFVGVLDPNYETYLYVNLRSMQILEDSLRLYAGGGIMPESEAKSEWQETEYKLQTLLSIL